MFDVFGNFDSVEELNACAKGLLEEQDLEHLKVLAEENGIPDGIREVYEQHLSEELVDSVNAAIGKLQVELKEETDGMPAGEIVSYLSMRCFEKEILARAVRRKNRTLKECLQNIRKEAEKRVKERRGAQMVAMPDLEVFAMAAGLLAVMYILYFRVSPKYGYVLVLTPIAFLLKIPYAVPLTIGLLGGPACVVPVACGTVFYYLIYYMKNNEAMLASSETEQMTSRLSYLVENVLNNKTVILTVLVFAVVLMIVYAIHRLSADHAWHIAIGAGAVTNIVLFLVGALVMQVKVPIIQLILGTLVSIVIAMAVEFFVFSVDYSRTEYAQFEDDEYYYYVKAVPKMSIAVSDKQVKRINTRRRTGQRKRH